MTDVIITQQPVISKDITQEPVVNLAVRQETVNNVNDVIYRSGRLTNLVLNPTIEPVDYGALGYFPTVATAYYTITCADYPALGITGDIDVRVKVSMNDWTPATNSGFIFHESGSTNRGWQFRITTGGILFVQWFPLGTTASGLIMQSTVPTGLADGATKWIRFTLDVDNGAGGRTANFYLSDDGNTWTQLGATVTIGATTTLFNSTADLHIGYGSNSGLGFNGKLYAAQIRNGINGTIVFNTDIATDYLPTDGFTYTSNTGQTMYVGTTNTTMTLSNFNYSWSPNTGTAISPTTLQSYSGRGSQLLTITTAGSGRGTFIPSGFRPAVTPGVTYTYTAYMRDNNTNVTWRNVIQWYSLVTGGTLISQNNGATTAISNSGWTRLTVTATCPVGATAATLFTQNVSSAALGTTAYFDAAQFEVGSATPYFDGFRSDYPPSQSPVTAWTGEQQRSTSIATYSADGTLTINQTDLTL